MKKKKNLEIIEGKCKEGKKVKRKIKRNIY